MRDELVSAYSVGLSAPPTWNRISDHAFLGTHLIERSIAMLSGELNGALIDVGCGAQPYRQYFTHVEHYTACDIDAKRGPVDIVSPAHDIPAGDNTFDCILCTEVLEHVPHPSRVWMEFYRLLRPGGRVLITTPMYWPSHEQPYDFHRFPAHGLLLYAQEARFSVSRLIPRGGMWALLGQVFIHVAGHHLRLPAVRYAFNKLCL